MWVRKEEKIIWAGGKRMENLEEDLKMRRNLERNCLREDRRGENSELNLEVSVQPVQNWDETKRRKAKKGRGTNLCKREEYGGTTTPEMGQWAAVGIQLAKVQKLREASWSTLIGDLFKGRAVLQLVAWSSCMCVRWEGSCCNPVAAEACRGWSSPRLGFQRYLISLIGS